MVTKSKKTSAKKGRVKVGKLKVNKETVRNLTSGQKKRIKGGLPANTSPLVCVVIP